APVPPDARGATCVHAGPGSQASPNENPGPPFQMHAAVTSRVKIMAGMDISERRLPQDGGIHVMMDKRPIDLRVSTMPGKHGEKVVIRIIDNEQSTINVEKLGFGY